MRKLLIVLILALPLAKASNGQQIVMNSMYMFNDFAINPAVAGTKNFSPITIGFRRQWLGIREAPVAQHVSYHGHVGANVGAGGYLYNDVAGATRRTGIMGAMSMQFATTYNTRISFGIAGSFSQYVLDREKLFTEEPNDPTVENYGTNMLVPDIAAGLHWYGNKHHIGISAYNLIQAKTDLFDLITPVTNTLDRTIYINGSYLIERDRRSKFSLEPSALLRLMFNAPLQFDVNLRAIFDHQYWIGASYRFQDAISIMAGFELGFFGFGYAYDINTSALQSFNSGSHEIILIFRTNKGAGEKLKWSNRNRVYECPAF